MDALVSAASASAAMAPLPSRVDSRRSVAWWLVACCALVFALVVVGGVTRLTHSGLSITEWQPVAGAVPPLSAADWNDAFTRYQATPEYRDVNRGMTLDAFKGIYWLEYFHRLLGRAIGFVFLIPFLWFVLHRRIPAGYAGPLLGIFVLGGLQGALGWYMVASGLVADPRVSQFRLTAHLGLAFLIYAAMLWTAWSLLLPRRADPQGRGVRAARRLTFGAATLVCVMVLSGGLVAGTRAGFAYNTFPLMHGRWVPPEIMLLTPWWKNFFWSLATVQFDHRAIAWLLAISIPFTWWRVRRSQAPRRAQRGADLLLVALVLQISLGVATLVNVVPVPLASMHQAGALIVFTLALNLAHALR